LDSNQNQITDRDIFLLREVFRLSQDDINIITGPNPALGLFFGDTSPQANARKEVARYRDKLREGVKTERDRLMNANIREVMIEDLQRNQQMREQQQESQESERQYAERERLNQIYNHYPYIAKRNELTRWLQYLGSNNPLSFANLKQILKDNSRIRNDDYLDQARQNYYKRRGNFNNDDNTDMYTAEDMAEIIIFIESEYVFNIMYGIVNRYYDITLEAESVESMQQPGRQPQRQYEEEEEEEDGEVITFEDSVQQQQQSARQQQQSARQQQQRKNYDNIVSENIPDNHDDKITNIMVDDFITLEEIKISDHLSADKKNMCFMYKLTNVPTQYYLLNMDDILNLVRDGNVIKYPCYKVGTSINPIITNVNTELPLFSLNNIGIPFGGYVKLSQIKRLIEQGIQKIIIKDTDTRYNAITSMQMIGPRPNAVGALHCQDGSAGKLYTLEKITSELVEPSNGGKKRNLKKSNNSIKKKHTKSKKNKSTKKLKINKKNMKK
jgi:hypothetical protein